ncbi:MAG TPA: hypothetical protein VFG36_04890 [Methanoregula sp.]|nr:hypothetical protein [Methanoregula sp.]
MPLSDLRGKGNFSVRSFAGRPLLLPVLSDACPSCVLQLSWQIREIEQLGGVKDGNITVIALDIDPPGDPGFISKHQDQFSFSGYTTRLPDDRILELLRTFGVFAVDTNTNPVILICPGGKAVLLPPGPKDSGSLETLMTKEC